MHGTLSVCPSGLLQLTREAGSFSNTYTELLLLNGRESDIGKNVGSHVSTIL